MVQGDSHLLCEATASGSWLLVCESGWLSYSIHDWHSGVTIVRGGEAVLDDASCWARSDIKECVSGLRTPGGGHQRDKNK